MSPAGSRLPQRVCLFGLISRHAGRNFGGTAMSIRRLANYFSGQGLAVDILMRAQPQHFLFDDLAAAVTVRQLDADSKPRLFLELLRYTRATRPDVLLAIDTRASLIASWLAYFPGLTTRLWSSFRSELNQDQARMLRGIARRSQGVIAISRGLAEDFCRLSDTPADKLHVIHNLAVTSEIADLARAAVDHPWLQGDPHPVLCAIGRLVPEKGFADLIEAMPAVRQEHPHARLLIIGQGPLLDQLRQQSSRLGLGDCIDFAGFQKNPWAFLARADLFVMPSLAEAFGNVLAEALSLGVPSVACDCPHGPAEILDHGRYGRLVPPADPAALAAAILETLRQPPERARLIEGAQRFTEAVAGRAYLETLGLT
jgi:glycosyltransferase involved in cell wall biosynthesis